MSAQVLPPCKCGEIGVYTHGQARGAVKIYYNERGNEIDIFTDNVWFDDSKTIRCEKCNHIRRDLELYNDPVLGRIVRAKP